MYGIYENGKVIAKFAAPMTVKSNQPVSVSDTLSLSRQISRRAAQRWEITSNLMPLSDDAQDLFVSLVTKGFSETVQVLMPQNYGVIKKRTNSETGTASGNKDGTQVNINVSGLLPKGSFVKFDSHSKVYITTNDVSGSGVVGVFPPLRAAVSGTVYCKDNVLMNCFYDTDTVSGMVYSDGILMDMGTVTLIERL